MDKGGAHGHQAAEVCRPREGESLGVSVISQRKGLGVARGRGMSRRARGWLMSCYLRATNETAEVHNNTAQSGFRARPACIKMHESWRTDPL